MLDRLLSALVALSLACLVWLYLRSRDQEVLDNVAVPVQIRLAPGQDGRYELEVNGPSQVLASFTGPPSRIRELRGLVQRGELQVEATLAVPADRLREGRYLDTVRVEASDIHAPPGVRVAILQGRNRLAVTLHRLIERRLPVRFESAGDERLARAVFEPATVLVRGPQQILERARAIPTQPQPLPSPAGAAGPEVIRIESLPLVQELKGHRICTSPLAVRARLTLQPQQKVYELTKVPVHFLCPANFPLRPRFGDERAGKIRLRVLGPAAEEPPAVCAFIDLSGRKWEPGRYEEPIQLYLPKDFQLAQNPPRPAAFQLAPRP